MPSHRGANFSRLKELLPTVPAAKSEATTTDEVAPTIAGESANSAYVQHTAAVHPVGEPASRPRSSLLPKPGRARLLTRPSTFRLAIELQEALKAVADYNRLNMTDIVAEGIWLHLQNFEWPPGSEELRRKLQDLL